MLYQCFPMRIHRIWSTEDWEMWCLALSFTSHAGGHIKVLQLLLGFCLLVFCLFNITELIPSNFLACWLPKPFLRGIPINELCNLIESLSKEQFRNTGPDGCKEAPVPILGPTHFSGGATHSDSHTSPRIQGPILICPPHTGEREAPATYPFCPGGGSLPASPTAHL